MGIAKVLILASIAVSGVSQFSANNHLIVDTDESVQNTLRIDVYRNRTEYRDNGVLVATLYDDADDAQFDAGSRVQQQWSCLWRFGHCRIADRRLCSVFVQLHSMVL